MKTKTGSFKKASTSYTIGRRAFAKISAVEGIRLPENKEANSKERPLS